MVDRLRDEPDNDNADLCAHKVAEIWLKAQGANQLHILI